MTHRQQQSPVLGRQVIHSYCFTAGSSTDLTAAGYQTETHIHPHIFGCSAAENTTETVQRKEAAAGSCLQPSVRTTDRINGLY